MAGLLGRLFRTKREPPPRVQSDTVLRAHSLDDTWFFRQSILAWTARFDDVLDANALHLALVKLLEIDTWRKFGGRFRLDSRGNLEIHIPEAFTPMRPAVRFSHNVIEQSIEDHPIGSQFPKPTDGPSLQPGSPTFRSLATGPDTPTRFEDYVYHDEPQMSLHITSFTDATLVTLVTPHLMTDGMGRRSLLEAWSLVLAGRESEVPPVLGVTEDVMRDVGIAENGEPYFLADQAMGILRLCAFLFRTVWNTLWEGGVESSMICLPPWFMAHLRQEAEAGMEDFHNIAEQAAHRNGKPGQRKVAAGALKHRSAVMEKPAFISEGDILSAWITQMVMATESRPCSATVSNAFQIRGRLPSVLQPGGTYVQNLPFISSAVLSAQEVAAKSLGYIAARVRTSLKVSVTEGQIHAVVRQLRKTKSNYMVVYGEPAARQIAITNTTKAKLWDVVDFGPAVIRPGKSDENRIASPGRIVLHFLQPVKPAKLSLDSASVIGKDAEGNYWINAFLRPGVLPMMQEYFTKVQQPTKEKLF